jgi:hypothetical protein
MNHIKGTPSLSQCSAYKIFKKSNNVNLTKFIEKIIYLYHTKYIPYKNMHRDESNGINLVFWMLAFISIYVIKLYII